MKTRIDINCDLGEGAGNDAALMPFISSCSIACGGHCGDKQSIGTAVTLAQQHGVAIGAHPSYPDSENFGRRSLRLPMQHLLESIERQLDLFFSIASDVRHVKFHGALYNDLARDQKKAEGLIDLVEKYGNSLQVYCPPQSVLLAVVQQSTLTPVVEGFADRAYTSQGALVARTHPHAVHRSVDQVVEQALSLVQNSSLTSITGEKLSLAVETLCFHGDNPRVIDFLTATHHTFKAYQIHVKSL